MFVLGIFLILVCPSLHFPSRNLQQDEILRLCKLDLVIFSVLQPVLQHFLMTNTRADQHMEKYFGALQT